MAMIDPGHTTGLDLAQHREVAYTWTERMAFPAHMATVPDTVPVSADPSAAVPASAFAAFTARQSPVEFDLLPDPALD